MTVGAVTGDFAAAIISIGDTSKRDRDNVGPRLEERYHGLVSDAETGMNLIESGSLRLNDPTEVGVRDAMDRLRQVYSAAYGWDAPPHEERAGRAGSQRRMRYSVRAAINAWDLLRLYPDAHPETESDEFRSPYEEDRDLEREPHDGHAAASQQ